MPDFGTACRKMRKDCHCAPVCDTMYADGYIHRSLARLCPHLPYFSIYIARRRVLFPDAVRARKKVTQYACCQQAQRRGSSCAVPRHIVCADTNSVFSGAFHHEPADHAPKPHVCHHGQFVPSDGISFHAHLRRLSARHHPGALQHGLDEPFGYFSCRS